MLLLLLLLLRTTVAGIGSRGLFRVVKCSCTEHGWLTIGVCSGVDGKRRYSFSFSMHRDLWYVW